MSLEFYSCLVKACLEPSSPDSRLGFFDIMLVYVDFLFPLVCVRGKPLADLQRLCRLLMRPL